MQKATVAYSIYIFDNSPCDERWMMKLQHLQTIQTCHCQRMSGTWHHDMPQHSAIQRSPPHTRPLRPRCQCGCCTKWCLRQRRLSSVPRPRPGGSDRSRLASRFQGPTDKTWLLKCSKQMTFNGEILQTSTVHSDHSAIFSIRIFADNSTRSEMNDETTAPPNQPNLSLSQDVGDMTSWHAAAFSDSAEPIPHTRPLRPRHQSGSLTNPCPWRTRLSSAPRPRPGNRDRSRLASSSRDLPFKSWSLKSGEHMTFNSDMWISLIQNLANNAESDSCLQHLHIWQLSLRWKMNDETTAPPNHPNLSLSKDVGDMTSWHAAAFSDSAEPTTHQAFAPSATIWLLFKWMFATEAFIFSASAKAWRQRQINFGV